MCLHERILSREELLLRLEQLKVAGLACNITLSGNLNRHFVGTDRTVLLDACLSKLLARDERIGNLLQGIQNPCFIMEPCLVPFGLSLMVLTAQLAAAKNRARNIRSDAPGVRAS